MENSGAFFKLELYAAFLPADIAYGLLVVENKIADEQRFALNDEITKEGGSLRQSSVFR